MRIASLGREVGFASEEMAALPEVQGKSPNLINKMGQTSQDFCVQ